MRMKYYYVSAEKMSKKKNVSDTKRYADRYRLLLIIYYGNGVS